ncbi:androgen-induced gene 1 protein-like [Galleria mellonella]|uniref:Androgen-induced gene 1 protein-like n=1 Tax=Galleria mellonella TaxID=7137 RepID=A0A6J1WN28_GALME|nr:androgen-induced gene 1 protein-like [Galleria mellonella]
MLLKTLFHLFGAIQFCYGCYYDAVYVNIPGTSAPPFGGKLKYLTYLDAIVQTVYFTIALLNDLFGNNDTTASEKPLIRRIKDILFCALAFPVAMYVGISFWGIYAVDRELILPRSLDPYFPKWLNHVMHTNIVVFILIELVTSFRMYPTRKTAMTILSTFLIAYFIWLHVIYFKTDKWVYPILAVLNWPIRIVFYLVSLGFVSSLYFVGEKLNRIVWSKEVEQTVKSGKKKAK